MAVKITPLANKVVAKQEESSGKTSSGFYLPEDAKDKPEIATVVAVGKDVKEVKKGDKIVYKTYSSPIKIEGEEYLMLEEKEVLAKLA